MLDTTGMLNTTALTISEVCSFLPAFMEDEGEDRISLCIWGPPGIGKTRSIEQLCARHRFRLFSWMRASQMEPIDVRGAPDMLHSVDILKWFSPDFFPTDDVKTVLFFDDVGQGLPAMQAALMQIILEYRSGKRKLPNNSYIIAASNREGDRSGVYKMLAALSSRFSHIDLISDAPGWCNWAFGAGLDPSVVAFIQLRPKLLHDFDPKLRSSPNPRGWERGSKIVKKNLPANIQHALLCGTVGEGAAREYAAFSQLWKKGLPNLNDIIAAPKTAPIPSSTDVKVAVASGLSVKATQKSFQAVMDYTDRLGPELDMFCVSGAVSRDPELKNTVAYSQWAIRNQDYQL